MAVLRHLKHINSNVTGSTFNGVKAPQATNIEYGEFAINYLKGKESVFIKNSENQIVKINDSNSIPFNNSVSSITQVINEISGVTSGISDTYVHKSGDTMSGNLYIGTNSAVTISTDGSISANGAILSSDRTLKENIETISEEDIEKVSQIDFKAYNFISDATKCKKYGIIAQDLEDAELRNLVTTTSQGTKGVDYISFLILKIAQLEKEIKQLKGE